MIPSPLIEHLLAMGRPTGGMLVAPDAVQILIRTFPPRTTLAFSAGPTGGDFAVIIYGVGLGAGMIPDAFAGYIAIWGTRPIMGVFTQTTLKMEFQSFLWVTRGAPAQMFFTNVTGLLQYFEVNYVGLRVATEADYKLVFKEIERVGTSARSEQLAEEANRLLGRLTKPLPAIEL